MKLKNFLFFLFFIFILFIYKSFALQITNIDYDPIGTDANKEWFEVCNDSVDILNFAGSLYKAITPGTSSYSSHDINIESVNSTADLLAGACAAIVDDVSGFKAYKPSYNNIIFDSSFSLTNTGGYVGIVQNKNILVCKSYGTGVCPTISTSTTTPNVSDNGNDNSTTSSSTIITNTIYVYVPMNNQNKYGDIQVLLPEEKIVPALADTDYTVKVTDSQKRLISDLDFNWSFGDGGEKFGKNASYHYTYPGDYTLIATADGFTSGAQARMNVKVVKPELIISKVGIDKDSNYIDLKNNTNYDLFLSDFYLNIDNKLYKLPKNLLIAKNKEIHISGEALGFKLPAINISLLYPNKDILTSYSYNYTVSSTEVLSSFISSSTASSSNQNLQIQSIVNKIASTNNKIEKEKTIVSKNSLADKQNLNKDFDKEIKLQNIPIQYEEIILKRLVFESENNKNIISNKEINNKEINNLKVKKEAENIDFSKDNDGVDTGLIKWFKNLLY